MARSLLRDVLFPRPEYRQLWELLYEQLPETGACRLMVGMPDLAGNGACEAVLVQRLAPLLATGALPDLEQLRCELAPRSDPYPSVTVRLPEIASYDSLLEAA